MTRMADSIKNIPSYTSWTPMKPNRTLDIERHAEDSGVTRSHKLPYPASTQFFDRGPKRGTGLTNVEAFVASTPVHAQGPSGNLGLSVAGVSRRLSRPSQSQTNFCFSDFAKPSAKEAKVEQIHRTSTIYARHAHSKSGVMANFFKFFKPVNTTVLIL